MSDLKTKLSVIVFSIIASLLSVSNSYAQDELPPIPFHGYFYIQPNIGLSQYFGDLNKDDFWNNDRQLGYGGVLGYQLSPLFGLRGQFLKTDLYSERADQDLKLNSDLWDGALNLTLNVNEIFAKYNAKRFLNIYLFTGAGISNFKSDITQLSTNTLLDSHTDWQHQFFLPVGGGASFRLSNTFSVNLEYGDHIFFDGAALDFKDGSKRDDHYSYVSAGVQINFGAKDSDRDGLIDRKDKCPEVFGKIELQGCPDRDNDGIADFDDACPDEAGKLEYKGCPDVDGDGIIDKLDACPQIAGKEEFFGCPDTDGDGIPDKDDQCPANAGKKEFNGCPDRDGDLIIDLNDKCPDVIGLAALSGCPDKDGDGIADPDDNCPDEAGTIETKGCPVSLKGAVKEKIVYFNTDGSIVIDRNIIDLNEIAAYINENPDAVVSVAGHADARESAEYNMRLSEKRADYVIKYLVNKGMNASKVEKSFYGKSKPVADNSTIEGRRLNRRVEIRVTK